MLKQLRALLVLFLALCVGVAAAQDRDCPTIVSEALTAIDDVCSATGRNEACYGNNNLTAYASSNVDSLTFDSVGDIADVSNIQILELSELDEEQGVWGVALMRLQADIPDTLPGQNVTFVLFGDVTIENAATDEENPMQAFYLRTNIGALQCDEAPESGLLVQTPDGVEEVSFNINGVDVQVGSTVLFQAEAENDMTISTVEGTAVVNFDDEAYPAVEGTRIRLPLGANLLPAGRPDLPEEYDQARMRRLPINQLPRRIDVAPPVIGENLQALRERIQRGELPCGIDGLPACDRLLPSLREGVRRLPNPQRWGQRFIEGENCAAPGDTASDLPRCPAVRDIAPLITEARENWCVAERVAGDRRPLCPRNALPNLPDDINCADLPEGGANVPRCQRGEGTTVTPREALQQSLDRDEDGIPNGRDACPFRAGPTVTAGCPVQDEAGVLPTSVSNNMELEGSTTLPPPPDSTSGDDEELACILRRCD